MKPEEIIALLSAIREKANHDIVRRLKKEGVKDLAPSHGAILVMLYRHETVTMTALAKLIRRDNSTVTTLVKKLLAAGYVKKSKDPNDQRVTNIRLTPKGKAFESIFESISRSLLEKLYKGFSDFEKEILIRLLEKLLKNC